jgi:glycosyltransferase involved in cell wall biosynthesis
MKKKVLVVPSDRKEAGYSRSINPHIELEKRYPDDFFIDIDYEPDFEDVEYLKQYDIVHYHDKLGSFAETKENEDLLVSLGIVPIMDISEYWVLDTTHPEYNIRKLNNIDKLILENIKSAYYVTCSSEELLKEVLKHREEASVLYSGVDHEDESFKLKKRPNRIRVGVITDENKTLNVRVLKDAVSKLKGDRLLDSVQFVLGGFNLDEQVTYYDAKTGQMDTRPIHPIESNWYEYEKILSDNYRSISDKHKKHLTQFSKEEFSGSYANEGYKRIWKLPRHKATEYYKHVDIMLLPYESTKYNQCMEPKLLAHSACGAKAVIAQNIKPYSDLIDNVFSKGGELDYNKDGFLVDEIKNHKDWYKHLKRLIQEPKNIKKVGKNLRSKALDVFSYDSVSERRRNLYSKLVDDIKK